MPILAGLFSFAAMFLALRHGWSNGILFYQGIASSILASVVTLAFAVRSKRASPIQVAKDSTLVFLASYAFMFTVPTTVERSYSVKLLEELDARGVMTEPEALSWIEGHWATNQGLAKRLEEQRVSGFIDRSNGRVSLTSRGTFLVRTFRLTAAVFATSASNR